MRGRIAHSSAFLSILSLFFCKIIVGLQLAELYSEVIFFSLSSSRMRGSSSNFPGFPFDLNFLRTVVSVEIGSTLVVCTGMTGCDGLLQDYFRNDRVWQGQTLPYTGPIFNFPGFRIRSGMTECKACKYFMGGGKIKKQNFINNNLNYNDRRIKTN